VRALTRCCCWICCSSRNSCCRLFCQNENSHVWRIENDRSLFLAIATQFPRSRTTFTIGGSHEVSPLRYGILLALAVAKILLFHGITFVFVSKTIQIRPRSKLLSALMHSYSSRHARNDASSKASHGVDSLTDRYSCSSDDGHGNGVCIRHDVSTWIRRVVE
jgi:hypothetical protein